MIVSDNPGGSEVRQKRIPGGNAAGSKWRFEGIDIDDVGRRVIGMEEANDVQITRTGQD
jgi:hypothetical protein